VLDGFTLTNGTGTVHYQGIRGGGIFCNNSDPEIVNNIIVGCTADGDEGKGGGIYLKGDLPPTKSPVVINNTIEGNAADGEKGKGGGIYCLGDFFFTPHIFGNTISGNSVDGDLGKGGGIYCEGDFGSVARIKDNTIAENTALGAGGKGGGIYLYSSSHGYAPDILNNVIQDNEAQEGGGGIYGYWYVSPDMENNKIIGNSGGEEGGGIFLIHASSPELTNNMIALNTAERGAGVYINAHCSPSLMNNTISHNEALGAQPQGGGIYGNLACDPEIINTILWGNAAQEGPQIWLGGTAAHPSTLILSYSNVEGGQGPVYVEPNTTLFWGVDMIDEDPLFTDALGGDFHLTWGSPCINRGTSGAGAPGKDRDGDPRPIMGTPDMGADEYAGLHRLEADTFALPEAGGVVNFSLNAGPDNGGRIYFLLGTISGTVPGFSLPGGQASLRINWDAFTNIVWNLLNSPLFYNFWVNLDPTGQGTAQMNAPFVPPGFVGVKMHYAFCLGWPWEFVSNPIEIEIVN
jgi:hypothetical protein